MPQKLHRPWLFPIEMARQGHPYYCLLPETGHSEDATWSTNWTRKDLDRASNRRVHLGERRGNQESQNSHRF